MFCMIRVHTKNELVRSVIESRLVSSVQMADVTDDYSLNNINSDTSLSEDAKYNYIMILFPLIYV